jgi:hypothetical protein
MRALAVAGLKEALMSKIVAEVIVETLQSAGVKRCYGVVGDTLNYVTDAIRRSGMTGVLGMEGGYHALRHCDTLPTASPKRNSSRGWRVCRTLWAA